MVDALSSLRVPEHTRVPAPQVRLEDAYILKSAEPVAQLRSGVEKETVT